MGLLFMQHHIKGIWRSHTSSLKKGAEVNAQRGHCGTALQAALDNGHLETIQLLEK